MILKIQIVQAVIQCLLHLYFVRQTRTNEAIRRCVIVLTRWDNKLSNNRPMNSL